MRSLIFLFVILFLSQISFTQNDTSALDTLLNYWHLQASKAKFDEYFNITSDNFIFLGTAPGERWNKKQFMDFSKPYFDKGKAWDFKAKNRKWIFSDDGKTAWFDEDLDTWMNTCRGSGICVKKKGKWKLAYFNLTVLIENEKIDAFIKLREE
ncbi:MAG: nuclear transport factor 2 family protein [Bacteroidota bacterium]